MFCRGKQNRTETQREWSVSSAPHHGLPPHTEKHNTKTEKKTHTKLEGKAHSAGQAKNRGNPNTRQQEQDARQSSMGVHAQRECVSLSVCLCVGTLSPLSCFSRLIVALSSGHDFVNGSSWIYQGMACSRGEREGRILRGEGPRRHRDTTRRGRLW